MRKLFLVTAAATALLSGSVLSGSVLAQDAAPPPHFPADLSPAAVAAADDHLALEQVDGEEAMRFVAESNRRAQAALDGDPRFEAFRERALAVLTSADRIPTPVFLGEGVGNFWQDATHPKGVWRRTTLESYGSDSPAWETLLDIDALAAAEGRDWVFKGANCLAPDDRRCLISLSDGGKDAVTVREFDTAARAFVDGGFVIPEGKHRISWLDRDTLLIATDFGPEDGRPTLTESGYPFIVKSLSRGQALDRATEVYRGDQGDGGYGVSPRVFRDAAGAVQAVIVTRPLDTFRSETWRIADGEAVRLNLPARVSLFGVLDDRLILSNDEAWDWGGVRFPEGSLLAMPLDRLSAPDPAPAEPGSVVMEFTDRQALQGVAVLGDRLVAAYSDNVVGRLATLTPGPGGWTRAEAAVADNLAVGLGDSAKASNRVFVSTQGFLTPPTLSLLDGAGLTPLRAAAAKFDASTHMVEQFEAVSADGTRIPYFVTRPREMAGPAAAILFGYGGFQISFPPAYKPEMGKLWLENGGVFVQANIRGGGEFGPGWHQAALNENRQRAFDDFAAVGRDLIARGITTARQLGIYGRSNGGVLTSVSVVQNPDLFNAAVIESPLIDMLRYHELPAGASWIGEYGDPRIPEEAEWIARYSAYQLLRPDAGYPRVYITTNTRDDRVHPGHARKFAARLADMGHDALYFEDTAGGHSNDADPVANARRWARHYVYLTQQLMDPSSREAPRRER